MSENFKISCSLKRTPVWASKETLDIILIIFFCKIIRVRCWPLGGASPYKTFRVPRGNGSKRAVPISNVESHILNRCSYYTGQLFVSTLKAIRYSVWLIAVIYVHSSRIFEKGHRRLGRNYLLQTWFPVVEPMTFWLLVPSYGRLVGAKATTLVACVAVAWK